MNSQRDVLTNVCIQGDILYMEKHAVAHSVFKYHYRYMEKTRTPTH